VDWVDLVGIGPTVDRGHPEYRTILAADIERYARPERTDPGRVRLRRFLSDQAAVLLTQAGAAPDQWAWHDNGDGWIISIDPRVPRDVLLTTVPAGLHRDLLAYNRDRPQADQLRIRLAIHAGEVLRDPGPFVGAAVDHACRLCDSDDLRACLRATTQPLAVMVSAAIYEGIVRHRYGELDPAHWRPIVARLKDGTANAWLHVPGDLDAPNRSGAALVGEAQAPYLGLAPYQPEDADRFFGREQLVAELLDRLARRRFLAVFGPSGSGKSSLLRAGLLPAVRTGRLPGGHAWPTALLTPGAHPLEELAIHLGALQGLPSGALAADLAARPANLDLAIRQALVREPPTTHLLIVVDQFEEVFTACAAESERAKFIEALLRAVGGPRSRARVVLGVRADFYGRCAEHPALVAALRDSELLIGPMTGEEFRAVIKGPAARAGLTVEPALVAAVLADAGSQPGALPMVSHALRETWQTRKGPELTLAVYQETGGVHGAVAQTAERVYHGLSVAQQRIAREILLALTAFGEGTEDTKRRITLDELLAGGDAAETTAVVEQLAANRLITIAERTVEVAHEALIRNWPRLRQWVSDDGRERMRVRRQLAQAATEWDALGREAGSLYRGARLAAAQEWAQQHAVELTALQRAFLQASLRSHKDELQAARRRNRRLRGLVALLAVLALLVATVSGFAVRQRQAADERGREAASQRLLFQAESLRSSQAGLSLLLGIAALGADPGSPSRASLVTTLIGNHYAGTLTGFTGDVGGLAFDPRNPRILATPEDQVADLWDVADQAHPRHLAALAGHRAGVTVAAWSPNGRTLATGSWDRTAILWDVTDPTHPRRQATLVGHAGEIFALAYSHDGRTLVTGAWDDTAILWDVTDPARPRRLATLPHPSTVSALAFSPDGRTVIVAGEDPRAIVWDVTDRTRPRRLATLAGHTNAIWSVAFSPDSRTAVTGSADKTAILWDLGVPAHPRQLGNLAGHTNSVYSVAFSPDGRTVATGSWDTTAILWDVTDPAHPVHLASLGGHARSVLGVAFSPDGRTLATSGSNHKVVLWTVADQASPSLVARLDGSPGPGKHVVLSPDGRIAVITGGGNDPTAALWDVSSPARPRRLATLAGHTRPVGPAAFSRDGRTLVTGSNDRTAILWDVTDPARPRRLGTLAGHRDAVFGVAFSPDGRTVITGSADLTAILWDVTDRTRPRRLATLLGHRNWVGGVAFSPDGRIAATTGADGRVILWDVGGPDPPRQLSILTGHVGVVYAVAFSPDGRTLASAGGDSTAILWDVADPAEPRRLSILNGHASSVFAVAFSPDGRILATGSWDKTAILWDVTDKLHPRQLTTLVGHTKPVANVTFSPDRHTMATVGDEGTTILWDVSQLDDIVSDPLARACAITGRDLSPQEWASYAPLLPYRHTCAR